jgi:predicted enzyme related to lactoylglutathione lyase
MPVRETAPPGAPCWIDLSTSDTAGSSAFYSALFGWTADEPNEDFGGYFNFRKDDVAVAGCVAQHAGMSDAWSVYLASDNAPKTLESAAAHGAQILVPSMEVADLGSMAVITDPTGAAVGVWQPGTFPGLTVLAEPGTPGWFELQTRDHGAAVGFYRDVFGWETSTIGDTDDFRYTVQTVGQDQLAGIMDARGFLPEAVPAHWAVYFAVADTDEALAKAVTLGGSIVQPAQDTPYGRLASALDPTGAEFKMAGPNAATAGSAE